MRAIIKQREQWIEPDGGRAQSGCDVDQVREVGKVSMAPVAMGADSVELDGDSP